MTANAGGLTGNVSDTSDDGDDTDGNTTDDPTVTIMEPTPSIEVTKTAILSDSNGSGQTDIGDSIKFIISIENTGNTNLSSLTFVDTLVDKNDSSLSLTNGPYFVSATQSSTVGNLNLEETAYYHAFFTINSQAINAGSVKNSVLATASSPGQSNNVTDTSDDGDDTDGNTTDDVTEVQVTAGGSINVTKESSIFDNGDGITGAGDTINYVIKITNTGTASITSMLVSDTLTDNNGGALTLSNGPSFVSASQGSSAGTLKPNEIATYSAAYVIQQAAAQTGGIKNSVTVTGSSPGNTNDVTDVSDDADDTDGNTIDDPTVVGISLLPVLEVTKTSTLTDNNSNGVTDLGDALVYNITVQNKGNVIIKGITIQDTPTDGNGNPLSLISTPTYISSSAGSSQGTLTVNETATYSATIIINQQAIDSGSISNVVSATGSSPGNTNDVTDISDDGDDSDGNTSNDPTTVSMASSSSIEATKVASVTDNNSNGVTDLGDTITYTITAQNKGTVTLSGVTIADTIVDGNSSALTLTAGPTYNSSSAGSAQGTLTVNEIATYTATYTINQQAVDSGSVSNTVVATASSPGQSNNVTDTSDDGIDGDGNTTDDATITSITSSPSIEVTKTATITDNGDGVTGIGDIVKYTVTVENKGNVTLTGLTFTDVLTTINGTVLNISSGPFFSGSSQGSAQGTIKVGETATYIAFYIIEQAAVDAGGISNTGSATASSPGNTNDVTDIGDDGDDTDGNTVNDPTVTTVTGSPSLEVTKTAAVTDNGDGKTGTGDVINYTVTVKNNGNVTLTGLTLADTLTDGNGGALSLTGNLGFSSTDKGSSPGTLKVGETARYSGYYIISSAAALTSKINNSVVATASSPGQTNNVTDTSDDGDDADGNTTDDVTETAISPAPAIEATKTATVTDANSNGITDTGDVIKYTITVENKGNVTLTGITLTDTLTDNNGNILTLTSGPTFNSASAGSAQGTITVGEIATYTATYTIESGAAFSTKVKNTVTVTGSSPGNTNDVTDISDDGNDNDGNTLNDQTEVQTIALASLEATKTATITDNGDGITNTGDTIVYTITVKNTGGVTLTGITLTDTLKDGNGGNLTLNGGPNFISASASSAAGTLIVNETATYTASYTITQAAAYTTKISNSVLVAGGTPGNTGNVTDTSDDGNDSDGNTTDDATETSIDPVALLEVTKTASVTDEGDGIVSAGDVINYTIYIENKGNITISSLTVSDVLTDGNGNLLTMNTGPYFSGSNQGSGLGTLKPGETATYRAYYIIEASVLNSGSISNTASATGSSPGNTNDVSDVSDDGDDTDGNTVNDPTITTITPSPILEVTKSAAVTDNGDGETGSGDVITYTITVENKGNVVLSGLTFVDTFTDGNNAAIAFTGSPTFVSASAGSSQGTLTINEIATYTASYTITQLVANTGSVKNSIVFTGSSPGQSNNVSDTSDDGDDNDGNTTDDVTIITTTSDSSMEVTKIAAVTDVNGNSKNDNGDIIVYTITVKNTGNQALTSVTLSDVLTDGNGNNLSILGPNFVSSTQFSAAGTLQPNEVATYTASYTISQAAGNTGSVKNVVTATGSSPGNTNDVSDVSDDGDDSDGNTTNDPTIVFTTTDSTIEVTKTNILVDTNGDGATNAGDVIVYNITVQNTGNSLLTGVGIVDNLTDGNGLALSLTSGPSFVSASAGSSQGTLTVNEIATYTATYTISQVAAYTGSINNSVVGTASSPGNSNNVTDTSDDGNDGDGNTTDDPTVVQITPSPSMEVTKSVTVLENGDGTLGVGDTVKYLIKVQNTGNVNLTGPILVDTFTDAASNTLSLTSGPTFDFADQSSSQGTIKPSESAYYNATFLITQAIVDIGGVDNTVTVTASSTGQSNNVSDTSDDGDDTDGNTTDDITELVINPDPIIEATKVASVTDTNANGVTDLGDVITYTITVENKGNVTLSGLTLVDTLKDGDGDLLTMNFGPFFNSSSASSLQGTLTVGEIATYTATFTINQQAVDSGRVVNTVLATASSPGQSNNVTDRSDNGDDSDGETEDDETVTLLQ